jgi:PAS domain S-box-containing protein
MDTDLHFTYISPSISRIRGYTVEEAMSQSLAEALTPASLEVARKIFQEELEIETKNSEALWRLRTIELEETCKNGSTIWTETTFSPLRNEQNRLTGILGITRDISERRQAEEEKKSLESRLIQAQKMEALGRFAGGIAHDLNNILYPIMIDAESLIEDEKPGTSKQLMLTRILKAANRQKDLIKQILSFSRRNEQPHSPINVIPILKETLDLLRSSLPSTIKMKHHIETTSDTIFGDPTQIQQIVMNLCRNAADAIGSQKGIIEVNLADTYLEPVPARPDMKAGRHLMLSVKDTGHGMNQDVMNRIYEPFYTTKEVGKGSGMGLAVVHGILKNHGGAVMVESEVGKGSLFTIYLPIIDEKIEMRTQALDESLSVKGKLTVVDEENILTSLQKVLKRIGYDVVAVNDGEKAYQMFRKGPSKFDLVITDLTMHKITGVELADKLMDIRPDIPVILCTGFNDAIDREEATAIGIRELLLKPAGLRELKGAIGRALEN